jgi:hypothetical protein
MGRCGWIDLAQDKLPAGRGYSKHDNDPCSTLIKARNIHFRWLFNNAVSIKTIWLRWAVSGIRIDRGNRTIRRNLPQRHFGHHKSRMTWPGIEPRPLQGISWLNKRMLGFHWSYWTWPSSIRFDFCNGHTMFFFVIGAECFNTALITWASGLGRVVTIYILHLL